MTNAVATYSDPETPVEIDPRAVDAHVGSRLIEMRRVRNVTQHGLAKGLDISYQQVQKYERGLNQISCSRLYAICLFFECRLDYFFIGLPCPTREDVEPVGRKKSPARRRIEELAIAPVGKQTQFSYGTFSSTKAAVALVNKVGRPGWAEVRNTSTGTIIKKVGQP